MKKTNKLFKLLVMGAIASITLLTMSSWKLGDEEKKETAENVQTRKTIRVEREVTAKEMQWFEGYHESDYLLLREGNLIEFFSDTQVDADYIYVYIVK